MYQALGTRIAQSLLQGYPCCFDGGLPLVNCSIDDVVMVSCFQALYDERDRRQTSSYPDIHARLTGLSRPQVTICFVIW